MKQILIGLALTFLALPAMAIGRGECCAAVNNICITKCTKDSCTGNGDCSLAFITRPPSIQSSSSTLPLALRTTGKGNQIFLKDLFAGLNPTGSGGRPDGEPIHVTISLGDGYLAPNPAIGIPTITQVGGATAYVPMEHASCGADCATHGVSAGGGSLNVPFKLQMSCPAGQEVSFVAYQLQGQSQVKLVEGNSGSDTFSSDFSAQPFSLAELEAACATALGGPWPKPGNHNNAGKEIDTMVQEAVEVWGKCSSWANTDKRNSSVSLNLTCDDLSWFAADPVL